MGMNLLQSLGRQAMGKSVGGQETKKAEPAVDTAAFQKMMMKVASSPSVQKASLLASEGIRDQADAAQKMGGLASRILQDPAAQQAIEGSEGPVEIKLMSDGYVSLKTMDGREKTVKLSGDAGEAAAKASTILGCLKDSSKGGGVSGSARGGMKAAVVDPLTFRYEPGSGKAVL